MSELQAALLAIGFGVIVVVYAFGWWQQRKYGRRFGAAFKANHADALYRENASAAVKQIQQPAPAKATGDAADETIAAFDKTVEPAAMERSGKGLAGDSCALLDMRSDFIIELHPAEPGPAVMLDGMW